MHAQHLSCERPFEIKQNLTSRILISIFYGELSIFMPHIGGITLKLDLPTQYHLLYLIFSYSYLIRDRALSFFEDKYSPGLSGFEDSPFLRRTCSLRTEWWSGPAWERNKDDKEMKCKTENIDALMLTTIRSNWQETMKMKQTSHRVAPVVTKMKQKKMNWHLKPLDQTVFAAGPLQFVVCRKNWTIIWMTSENPMAHEMKSLNATNSCIWEDYTKYTL